MKRFIPILFVLSLVVPAAPAMAGIPVIDAAKIGQDVVKYISEIAHWLSVINQWRNQALGMKRAYDSTIGNRDIGGLVNTLTDKQVRQYMPEDWDSGLEAVHDASVAVTQLDREIANVSRELNHMTAKNMYADPTSRYARDYERRRYEALSAMSLARGMFNRGKLNIQNIEKLMTAIDRGGNDQKAALDLNSRVTAEVALLNTQSLQIQSTMAKQMAEMQNYWNEMDAKEANMSRDLNKNLYRY